MPAPERIWLTDGGDYDGLRRQQLLTDDNLICWSTLNEDDDDTGYVRADLHDRALDLLRRCAAEIVAEVQATLLSDCLLRRDGVRFEPLLETAGPATRDLVEPQIDLLREVESLTGRLDTAPFLRALLDGRAELGGVEEDE